MIKKILIPFVILLSLSCMSIPPKNEVPLSTSIAIELTRLATANPIGTKDPFTVPTNLPIIVTFPPPAVGAPTQIATVTNEFEKKVKLTSTYIQRDSFPTQINSKLVTEISSPTVLPKSLIPEQEITPEIVPPVQNTPWIPIQISENVFIDPSIINESFPNPLSVTSSENGIEETYITNISEKPITLSVSGDAIIAEISFINNEGKIIDDIYSLPFEQTNFYPIGAPLFLKAKVISEKGSITCEIRSEQTIIIQNANKGFNEEVYCTKSVIK